MIIFFNLAVMSVMLCALLKREKDMRLGETVIGANDIYFTVPYDAFAANNNQFIIRELELASETATVTFSRVNDGGTDYYYTTEAATDKVVTDGRPEIRIQDGDILTITNNGKTDRYEIHIDPAVGFTSFTTEEGLDAIVFPESGEIAVMLPYGYSNDKTQDITVTPVFELDYPTATASWRGGALDGVDDTITVDPNFVTDGTRAADGNVNNKVDTTFDDFAAWLAAKNGADSIADLRTAGASGLMNDDDTTTPPITNPYPLADGKYFEAVQLTITYSENASRTYDVYFLEPFENSEAIITEFSIGSEIAEIDQEAMTIDITVPMGTDVSDLNGTYTVVDLTASNNALISVPMQAAAQRPANRVTVTENGGVQNTTNDRARYVGFDMNGTLDGTNSVEIRVESQDGLTENFYTLNVTVADEFVKPAFTYMGLRSPEGDVIDGEITTNANNVNIVTFEVPYEVYDRGELNNWSLLYTKTVGATATYQDNTSGNNPPAVTLPRSGSAIGAAPYIPDPNDTELTATPIDLNVEGAELSAETTSYTIQIIRTPGQQVSTLDDFDLVGVPNFTEYDGTWNPDDFDDLHSTADVGDRFVYDGDVNNEDHTITVDVPWSVHQQWDADEFFNAIALATLNDEDESANTRIFLKGAATNGADDNGVYTAFVNAGDENATEVTKEGATGSAVDQYNNSELWRLYDGAQIIVMSEELWVNLMEDTENGATLFQTAGAGHPHDGQLFIDVDNFDYYIATQGDDAGNFTIYTLNIEQANPRLENELDDLRLVDGTGWTAALAISTNQGGGTITGSIPYALTSDITNVVVDANGHVTSMDLGDSVNPVYLEYSVSPYGFVLGVDNDGSRTVSEDGQRIPTAGTDRDGVFIDIADYLALYEDEDGQQNYDLALEHYFTDGNPYFLIDRDGHVYIFNDSTVNRALVVDMLAVSSEAPSTVVNVNGETFIGKYQQYDIQLDVLPANKGTQVNSFWFEEYPTRKGVIDEATKTITVTLPYGTDLTAPEYTYLTPNFEVSDGAIVTIDDPVLQGKPLFPGYTDVNFSTTRKMTVIAENEADSTSYTIRVVVEEQFSDVNPGDWFYDNVMDAAANGYVNGYTDGTFGPTKSITRAEFAALVANVMGYETNNDVDSAFKDVEQGHWANGAIAFCAERGYINGYTDGTFQPSKTITRQEAASILKNTFNLTGNTGDLFPDDSAIASWAKDNVYAVKHSGLMKGDAGTGMFRPTSTITRAEAASILMNANRAGLIK